MDAEEQILQEKIEKERLNSAYRTVFGADPEKRSEPQKRLIQDFEDILKGAVFRRDQNGNDNRDAAALNDGARGMVRDMLLKINSEPKTLSEKETNKPKIIK